MAENFRLRPAHAGQENGHDPGQGSKALRESAVRPTALALSWNGPLKDTAGAEHEIAVRMDVKAAGNALEFRLHLDNGTDGKVKEVWYPMIGGLARFGAPGKPADGVLWVPTSTPTTKKIELPFGSDGLRRTQGK